MKDIIFSEPEGDQQTVYMCRLQAPFRAFAFNQITASVVAVVLAFTACVDALAELTTGVVAVVGFLAGAVAVAEQLAAFVPFLFFWMQTKVLSKTLDPENERKPLLQVEFLALRKLNPHLLKIVQSCPQQLAIR